MIRSCLKSGNWHELQIVQRATKRQTA
jgi:hypothetical protein